MSNTVTRKRNEKPKFTPKKTDDVSFLTGESRFTLEEKQEILRELGQEQLVDLFKEWKPRKTRKRRGAPLDQRVAITVTDNERMILDSEIARIKKSGEGTSLSQFIRNRALGSVDIHGWKDIATEALKELTELEESASKLRIERNDYLGSLDEADDEDVLYFESEISKIDHKLSKLVARNEKRSNRLTGRMSMSEAEVVKWRAQRLCISSSDYLRMMIFSLEPNSPADAHMSLDAKRRFYVSIVDVAVHGWGNPPNVYECSQCVVNQDELAKALDRIKQLETFVST